MELQFILLDESALPEQPEHRIQLDARPLSIVNGAHFDEETDTRELSTAIGIATVLYNWCPDALIAFLDLVSWFSLTWTLTLPNETKLEIGRLKNLSTEQEQVTFGELDKDGAWKLMLSYDIGDEGIWIPNTEESMLGDEDITDAAEIERLGRAFVRDLILEKRWLTGKKMRHEFFIEYAPTDPFGDGIAMNPHWLYKSLDLSRCTTCDCEASESKSLNRCGRCGTSAYCSSECQRKDWAVHKAVCSMDMEERGKALHLSNDGGLIKHSRDYRAQRKAEQEASID